MVSITFIYINLKLPWQFSTLFTGLESTQKRKFAESIFEI